MSIVHICPLDKFIPPFIDFVRNKIGTDGQLFLTYRNKNKYPYECGNDTRHIDRQSTRYFHILYHLYKSDKVIIHGLFDKYLIIMLALQPWLLKKCYWLMWGADLYFFKTAPRTREWKIREFFRRIVIRNVGHLVTSIDGDYDKAIKWYGAKGKRLPIFTYPASLYKEVTDARVADGKVNILLGNSADPSNNHEDALKKLSDFHKQDIMVYCPLSYGDKKHAAKIIKLGDELLGSKFVPITKFMALEEYNKFLSDIDIVLFNHDRQQAMSSIRVLLGMGKKVYMRKDITSFDLFEKLGVIIHSIDNIDLVTEFEGKEANINLIKNYYSEETLKKNIEILLNHKCGEEPRL